jgi:DNA-binding MarR family transcriptional regulator
MSKHISPSFELTTEVRDTCVCLHTQRAARALARRFDEALRPLNLTNGQFSLLNALNRAEPPTVGSVATLLAMDRTTLTANLKPLERRGFVVTAVDETDRRIRRLRLSPKGRMQLKAAIPVWKQEHAMIDRLLGNADINRLRVDLLTLS